MEMNETAPIPLHPDTILDEIEDLSKKIIEFSTRRNILKDELEKLLERVNTRHSIIEDKFHERMSPTERAVPAENIVRGRDF